MENQTLALETVRNILAAEQSLRIGQAVAFGLSFFLFGIVLQDRTKTDARTDQALRFARLSFLFGTFMAVAGGTLAFISPSPSTPQIVLLGINLALAFVTLFLDRGPQGMPALSFLTGALIWLLTVAQPFVFPHADSGLQSFWGLTGIHIVTAIGGEALCMISFCASLLYLWDYKRLKSKHLARRPFIPSLDTLDTLVERTTVIGLFLISTSLVTGVGLVLWGEGQSVSTLKVLWAFAVWGWYVLSIFGRGFWGWRGRKGAQLSLWGTALMIATLFGTLWSKVDVR